MALVQPNSGIVFRRERVTQPGEPPQITYLVVQGISDLDRANAFLLSGAADNLGAGQASYTAMHNTYTDGQYNTDTLPGGNQTVNVSAPASSTFSDSFVNNQSAISAPGSLGTGSVGAGVTGGVGTGGGGAASAPAMFSDPGVDINTGFVGDPLDERDPMAAFQAALGLTGRRLTDPYRRYVGNQYETFFRPFQYQNVMSGALSPGDAGTLPGFQQYLANIGGSLATARQNAANVFNQLVGGGGGEDIQSLLSGNVARETPYLELQNVSPGLAETLREIEDLGRSGMRGRLGSAAAGVLGRFVPNASDLYQDYYLRSRAGEQVAPTFGQALQAAYGLG